MVIFFIDNIYLTATDWKYIDIMKAKYRWNGEPDLSNMI